MIDDGNDVCMYVNLFNIVTMRRMMMNMMTMPTIMSRFYKQCRMLLLDFSVSTF